MSFLLFSLFFLLFHLTKGLDFNVSYSANHFEQYSNISAIDDPYVGEGLMVLVNDNETYNLNIFLDFTNESNAYASDHYLILNIDYIEQPNNTYLQDATQTINFTFGQDYLINSQSYYLLFFSNFTLNFWIMNASFRLIPPDIYHQYSAATYKPTGFGASIFLFSNKSALNFTDEAFCLFLYYSPCTESNVTFQIIDWFNYFNVTYENAVSHGIFYKGSGIAFHLRTRFEPESDFLVYSFFSNETRFIPIQNCKEPANQSLYYVTEMICPPDGSVDDCDEDFLPYTEIYYVLYDVFDRDIRYPDEYFNFTIIGLLPPMDREALFPQWFSFEGTFDLVNIINVSFVQFNYLDDDYLLDTRWDSPSYMQPPILEDDVHIIMISSDSRANAFTNLTFVFNTCIPLFMAWQMNVSFIEGIDAGEYVENPLSELILGENLSTNETVSFLNFTKLLKQYNINDNSLDIIFNFPNVSINPDFPYNHMSYYPIIPSINYDTTIFDKPPPRIYATFNFTLANIWNANYVGVSPDIILLNFTYPFVPPTYHPIRKFLNTSNLHLTFMVSILQQYQVTRSHDLMNEAQIIQISFHSPVYFRIQNYFLYQFPIGTLLDPTMNVTFLSGFDAQTINWTLMENGTKLLLNNPFQENMEILEDLVLQIQGVVFTNANMQGFETNIYNTSGIEYPSISITQNVTIPEDLIVMAELIDFTTSFTNNVTMDFTDMNISFCFDHDVPNNGGMAFELLFDSEIFLIKSELCQGFINDEEMITNCNGNAILMNYENPSLSVFLQNIDCPRIYLRNLINPRSIKPVIASFQLNYQHLDTERAIASGNFTISLNLIPKTFIESIDNLFMSPNSINTPSTLNLIFNSEILAQKNDNLLIEIPSIFTVLSSIPSCSFSNISASCFLIETPAFYQGNLMVPLDNIQINDTITLSISALKTPELIYALNGQSPVEISFNGTSNEGFLMFFGYLSIEFPVLTAISLDSIEYNRSNYFIAELSNISFSFISPLALLEGMIMNFTINGSFETISNKSQSLVVLKDIIINGYINDDMTSLQIPFNLSENSIIEFYLLWVKNPENMTEDIMISINMSVFQINPIIEEILVYSGSFNNQWTCNSSCKTCFEDYGNCIICEESYYLLNTQCYLECPMNYQPNDQNKSCDFFNETTQNNSINQSNPDNNSSSLNNNSSSLQNNSSNTSNNSFTDNNSNPNNSNNNNSLNSSNNLTDNNSSKIERKIITSSSKSSFYPSNLAFIDTDFDYQFFLTYYIIITGLYVFLYSLYCRRKSQSSSSIRKTKSFMFFWTILEVFCLYLMIVKLALLKEYVFMSFFLINLLITYIHHIFCMKNVWKILNKDDFFLLGCNEGNKSFIAFNCFMFLWNYRISFIFLSKMWMVGNILREEPVINELTKKLKFLIKTQYFLQTFTLILLISFLGLRTQKFIRIPFFFIEYVVFMALFMILSINEGRFDGEKNEIPQNEKFRDTVTSPSPILSPMSLKSPLEGEKRGGFGNEIKNMV